MKIALAQLNYTVGDVDGNARKIIDTVRRVKAEGAELVVFAEQAISGAPAFDLLRKYRFLEQCEDALRRIAAECDTVDAIVGLPYLTPEGPVSAAAVIEGGRVVRYVGKQGVVVRRELGFLTPSKGCEYVTLRGHRCALVLGEDLYHTSDFDQSVETIIDITARRYRKGDLSRRYEIIRNIAYVNGKNVVMVNQVGGATEVVYDGMSGVMNGRGELVMLLKGFEEEVRMFDTERMEHPVESIPVSSKDRTRFVWKAAVCGLRDFFVKNGYRKACVGVSGGIDSAVVACLAVSALGRENVRGLMMPSQFSPESSVEDAKQLAENLGIDFDVVPISEAYRSVVDTLIPVIGGTDFDRTEENIQARIRTLMLMALQNKSDCVLLNSSNKSENALGLCTLYGDTAGAFSVTGDLYKTEIYDLARFINREIGAVIPENILTKEPSSELHPGQKDSDILPPYEVVDAILYRMIEEGQPREEIINAGFDCEQVQQIYDMVMGSEKKRFQYPPVLRLSACSFGHEYRMPLTHKYGK
ncbi:MAG: NAD+ synthase [Alistipes sp.]|nr:NAD+ synthase [Alistipes sp.]